MTALVARIKVAPGYTDSIGQALQIVGADQAVDLTSLKPVLTDTLGASQVTVGWTKQDMEAVEIFVDRSTGFVPGRGHRAGLHRHRAPARRRPERALEIQGHLPPRRRPRRPME